ncbi:MAG TPA: helix-turn-helix transcriptional regulator [Xanthobacteraceae bacterium]|nr:helix-turn-helix transcriptional regulator [Xanthobacteraceae bacterium]
MRAIADSAEDHAAFKGGSWRAELLPRHAYRAAYTPDTPIIGFAFESQAGIHAFASDRRVRFQTKPNTLAYVPPGCDVYSQSDQGGEYLKVTFEWEHGELWPRSRRFSDVIDAAAIDAAQQLRRQLLANGSIDKLQCERLVHALKERTMWALSGISIAPAARSWMTPRRLRLVDELIEARLDAKLTVRELAAALRLSTGFFCRAFKASVGKAPHDYIVDRRVSRARALLQGTPLDLSAVAHASGFASHAHMTATFRSRLGVTPSALRT